jgi:hypothetical protein
MKKRSRIRTSHGEKRVRFSSAPPNIRLCLRIEEPIWYQEKDFAAFERENRKTISLLKKYKLSELDAELYCIDGLEFLMSKSLKKRTNNRFRDNLIRQTILRHHQLQKCHGKYDPELLKDISQLFSGSASYRAQIKAAIYHVLAT